LIRAPQFISFFNQVVSVTLKCKKYTLPTFERELTNRHKSYRYLNKPFNYQARQEEMNPAALFRRSERDEQLLGSFEPLFYHGRG
jgi:hypothetical protein